MTVLSERGAPTPVAWTRMRAPQSLMAPSAGGGGEPRSSVLAADRALRQASTASRRTSGCRHGSRRAGAGPHRDPGSPARRPPRRPARGPKEQESVVEQVLGSSAVRSMLRSAGSALGREITRSLFGTARRRR